MSRRFINHPRRDEDVASPEFTRLLFIAFGIAMLIGLVTGSIWIAWNLIRLYVLR
jgi:hypothetical protein